MFQTEMDRSVNVARLDAMLQDDREQHIHRLDRNAFTDAELFELEMKHIFEGNWVYLAHESQIPNINDYFTTWIGRQPIVITRNKDGVLNAIPQRLRAPRRDAVPPQARQQGQLHLPVPRLDLQQQRQAAQGQGRRADAGYPEQLQLEGSPRPDQGARASSPIAASCSAASSADVLPLVEHLGESAKIIDMIVDQSPDGLEVLRGASSYIYDGNWKLQTENGADGYHVSSVHWNYAATQNQRKQRDGRSTASRP